MAKPPILLSPANFLRRYHQHRVVGMENIPSEGAGLIVAHHSFATYDSILLGAAIFEEKGRLVHALGHHLLFRLPIVKDVMTDAGAVAASPQNARALLADGQLLGLTPGGMKEALRSSRERYRIRWADRKGFVRLAIETGAPVVLAACPKADEILDVSTGVLTDFVYDKFRLPLAFVRGWGPIPRAIALTHYVDKPRFPPPAPKSKKKLEAVVEEWHAELSGRMSELLVLHA